MKKTIYNVEWNGISEIHIEIEHSEKTNKLLHLINNFWSDSEEMLRLAKGDITEAVLKRITSEALRLVVTEDYGVNHLIQKLSEIDGYPVMDGSCGIRIVNYDSIEFEPEEMNILIVSDENGK